MNVRGRAMKTGWPPANTFYHPYKTCISAGLRPFKKCGCHDFNNMWRINWNEHFNYWNQKHDRWFLQCSFSSVLALLCTLEEKQKHTRCKKHRVSAVKEVSSDSSFCSHLTGEIVLLHVKGAKCKNWPPVYYTLKTIRGQHIGCVTANCCHM